MRIQFKPNGEVEIYQDNILLGKGQLKDDKIIDGYNSVVVENILEDFYVKVAKATLPKESIKE